MSIIGFDGGNETELNLDGHRVTTINADLSTEVDLTTAKTLADNAKVSFIGDVKSGKFEVDCKACRDLLGEPNPTGRRNLDVLLPWCNARDLMGRPSATWIVDFGDSMSLEEAAGFEKPFDLVRERVKPVRDLVNRKSYREYWWMHAEPCGNMRRATMSRQRFLATARVSKHRLFLWIAKGTLADCAVVVFARSDDYFFGSLQSAVHELWARGTGTQLREAESGFRYSPTSTFETFPLPWPPVDDVNHPAHRRISTAAKNLNDLRERWLNPPEWLDPLAARIDATDDFADVPPEARPLIRHSAIMAAAAKDARLKNRTLTKLYNERPTWLKHAHETLDRAVLAAYAATDPDGDWNEDWAEVWTDTGAGQTLPPDHPLNARRAEVDQKILANLLRLNYQRAGKVPPLKT